MARQTYHRKSIRKNGKVTSTYIGSGEYADALVEMERLLLVRARFEAAKLQIEREKLETHERLVAGLQRETLALARAALVAAGYHQHDRGEWRRKSMGTEMTKGEATTEATDAKVPVRLSPVVWPYKTAEERKSFLDRSFAGDESTRKWFRDVMVRHPDWVVDMGGDLAGQVAKALSRWNAGDKAIPTQEAALAKIATVRAELAGPDPTPLERLLAERAALTWADANLADLWLMREEKKGKMSSTWLTYLDRRRDRAHKRFLAAVKALALVRRLALPVLIGQINVAENQVNMAGPHEPA